MTIADVDKAALGIRDYFTQTFPNAPVRRQTLFFPEGDGYHGPQKGNRLETGLRPSRHVYKGEWFLQDSTNTCVAWAFANAFQVVGCSFGAEVRSALHNVYKRGKESNGLWLGTDVDQLKNIPGIPVEITQIDLSSRYTYSNTFVKKAEKIVEAIANGGAIVTAVDYPKFRRTKEKGVHAVTIAGYQQGKYLYLQVIDPVVGIFWTTAEHVLNSITVSSCGGSYVVKQRKNGSLQS